MIASIAIIGSIIYGIKLNIDGKKYRNEKRVLLNRLNNYKQDNYMEQVSLPMLKEITSKVYQQVG
ncbi:hypothetical protein [Sphingobacterium sp. UBA2610]|uniref:hypothetical protein n=1 Tax=Sphingobacterium sp. UBA2610 TaxID=1947491 RepID=UPI00257B4A77|nr:hypothetical protein [Sphingobacterium sp. UBA2610]